MIEIEGFDHIAIGVRDLQGSAAWYQRLFGLGRRHEEAWDVPIVLAKAGTALALFPPRDAPGAGPGTSAVGLRHIAFRVTRDNFERAKSVLDGERIGYEFQDHDIAHSMYFPDPDGNQIEITTYDLSPPRRG